MKISKFKYKSIGNTFDLIILIDLKSDFDFRNLVDCYGGQATEETFNSKRKRIF